MRSIVRFRSIAIAAVVAVALTACGADEPSAEAPGADDTTADDSAADGEDPADEAAETEQDEDPGDGQDAAPEGEPTATDTVQARNVAFEPADIEVTAGTTVTWVNEDLVNHTVTSGSAGDPDGMFDEPLPSEGDDVTVTFEETGTVAYYCDLHRNMVGTVTVTG